MTGKKQQKKMHKNRTSGKYNNKKYMRTVKAKHRSHSARQKNSSMSKYLCVSALAGRWTDHLPRGAFHYSAKQYDY